MHHNSRNRFPLIGLYKEVKKRSKLREKESRYPSLNDSGSWSVTATSPQKLSSYPLIEVVDGVVSIDTSLPCNSVVCVDTLTMKLQEFVAAAHRHHKVCPDTTAALRRLIKEYWTWRLQEAPEFATMSSVHDYDDRLSCVSVQAITERVARSEEFLKQLLKLSVRKLDRDDRLNWKLLKVDLEAYIEGFPWRRYSAFNTVNFMENIPLDFGTFLIDAMKFNCQKDFENYLSRLRAIPVQVREEIALMREAIEHGTTLHKCCIDDTEHKLDKLVQTSAEQSYFFSPFEKLDALRDISAENKTMIRKEAKEIIEKKIFKSMMDLKLFLHDDYLPNTRATYGVGGLPDGSAFYDACLKWHLSIKITAKEVHEIGLQEVARIRRQMIGIMKDLNFEGSLLDFMKMLKEDRRFYNDTMEEMLVEYKKMLKTVVIPRLPKFFNEIPSAELAIVDQQHEGPGAQYIPTALDGSRPGQFQVSSVDTPRYCMMALLLHEGMPGHHLQCSTAIKKNLPDFRKTRDYRRIFGAPLLFPVFTAYDEGWALYSEYLGEEMGVYRDNFELFGRYCEEMVRAVRLVVDTGLHLYNWSYKEAVEYMNENTCMSESEVISEVNRYLTWPGQACAYKIGELKFKELRRLAESRLGESFNVRDFHDVVLGLGAVPLLTLEAEVKEWIERVLASDSSSDASDD